MGLSRIESPDQSHVLGLRPPRRQPPSLSPGQPNQTVHSSQSQLPAAGRSMRKMLEPCRIPRDASTSSDGEANVRPSDRGQSGAFASSSGALRTAAQRPRSQPCWSSNRAAVRSQDRCIGLTMQSAPAAPGWLPDPPWLTPPDILQGSRCQQSGLRALPAALIRSLLDQSSAHRATRYAEQHRSRGTG